jgi:hypothetical protein
MLKLITNIWTNPRSTMQGLFEGGLLGGLGYLVAAPDQLKLVLLLAAWRLLKGLMSADLRKLVDQVLTADAQADAKR